MTGMTGSQLNLVVKLILVGADLFRFNRSLFSVGMILVGTPPQARS